jgi:hypothetical protein
MANFAIHDGVAVVNVIVADSKEIAEQVTSLEAIETTGEPWTGWVYQDGEWINPFDPVLLEEQNPEPAVEENSEG